MIARLDKVTLYVNSQDEAVKFWTEKLGFVKTFDQEMGPGMRWIEVSPKGENLTTLVLYSKKAMQQQNPGMVAHPSVLFKSDNVEEAWKTMKAKGIEVGELQNLPYGKMFNLKDNDGNLYLVRN